MSVHLEAERGEIAENVLLPGDPLRAKYIAETYLENPVCYNQVRGMLGYTGTYQGRRVSVQGTGMGMPSAAIYIHELIADYGAKRLIRIGTSGALREDVRVRDVILALSACTDSNMFRHWFPGITFAPTADFALLDKAVSVIREIRQTASEPLRFAVGSVFTTDSFYADRPETVQRLGTYGVLAIEMETAALYALAAKFGVQALSITTVSDHLLTGEQTTAQERQTSFNQMMEIALKTVVSL
jgi:purine-nucleoside phosphorylase